MKKAVGKILKVGGIIFSVVWLVSETFGYIGLYANSLKNRGYKKIKYMDEETKKKMPSYQKKVHQITQDVLDDIIDGWDFLLE